MFATAMTIASLFFVAALAVLILIATKILTSHTGLVGVVATMTAMISGLTMLMFPSDRNSDTHFQATVVDREITGSYARFDLVAISGETTSAKYESVGCRDDLRLICDKLPLGAVVQVHRTTNDLSFSTTEITGFYMIPETTVGPR